MEIAKFIFTAIGTFITVFGLSFSIFQHWRKRQDEKFERLKKSQDDKLDLCKKAQDDKFELLKKSLENSIQKETEQRKESVARIEKRVNFLENTAFQRFESRLSSMEGELRGMKSILLSMQNWFIENTRPGSKR